MQLTLTGRRHLWGLRLACSTAEIRWVHLCGRRNPGTGSLGCLTWGCSCNLYICLLHPSQSNGCYQLDSQLVGYYMILPSYKLLQSLCETSVSWDITPVSMVIYICISSLYPFIAKTAISKESNITGIKHNQYQRWAVWLLLKPWWPHSNDSPH